MDFATTNFRHVRVIESICGHRISRQTVHHNNDKYMHNKLTKIGALAAVGCMCLLGYVSSQWPAKEYESNIPAGKIEEANFLGERVKIIKTTNGFFLLAYPTGKPAK
jgi:hypothetical protein